MFFFFIKRRLYIKKILKKENNIRNDKIITCEFSFIIDDKSLAGMKPPEEIKEKAKFRESKLLILKILRITNISNVNPEYNKKIFKACLNISELSKEIKFVKVFLKLSS